MTKKTETISNNEPEKSAAEKAEDEAWLEAESKRISEVFLKNLREHREPAGRNFGPGEGIEEVISDDALLLE